MAFESFQRREEEALQAIKHGEASPTISFALEKGGEVFNALEKEIKTMNSTQRRAFAGAINMAQQALRGKLTSTDEFDKQWYRIFTPVIGISLGAVVEALIGIPYATVAGGGAGLAFQTYLLKLTARERQAFEERLRLCNHLLKHATEP